MSVTLTSFKAPVSVVSPVKLLAPAGHDTRNLVALLAFEPGGCDL